MLKFHILQDKPHSPQACERKIDFKTFLIVLTNKSNLDIKSINHTALMECMAFICVVTSNYLEFVMFGTFWQTECETALHKDTHTHVISESV